MSLEGIDLTLALWDYDAVSAPLVSRSKSVGGRRLIASLGRQLGGRVEPYLQPSTVVTWVPPSPHGLRRRGFDQGRVLATSTAKQIGSDTYPAFTRSGRAQFGGDRARRLQGPRMVVRPDWRARPPTDQVVLVDDVITTGSTMAVAARLLRAEHPRLDVVAVAVAARQIGQRSVDTGVPRVGWG
ncbi:MAG: ComF family protein [Acidimicrobiales bacterium]|nr:ComF family protein [Acidimicrobiales bacterium]